ncbi:hypothetical protein M0805_001505 [Coniferiporia weirii]|nr:hypothetical protein M0805_001505 [Coniferiporia weirii]
MSPSGSTSSSDEQSPPATKDKLQELLDRIAHLNLTGKISDISPTMKTHGAYSDIFTGYCSTMPSGEGKNMKVAIKRLRVHIMDDTKLRTKLVRELYIWSKLDHSYILPLRGYYFEDNHYPCLVSMWMENDTVLKYLESHTDCDLQQMVLRIAEGINYLHQRGIIHSDIKPQHNILISSSGEPRICDFGISRMFITSGSFTLSQTTGNVEGTVRYMSIELLTPTNQQSDPYSEASDVWAFGMTLLVLLTRRLPYSHIKNDYMIVPVITSGTPPAEPSEMWSALYQFLWQLCVNCWAKEPSERPSMSTIISTLKTFSTSRETSTSHLPGHEDSGMLLDDKTRKSDPLNELALPINPSNEDESRGLVSRLVLVLDISLYIHLHLWVDFGKPWQTFALTWKRPLMPIDMHDQLAGLRHDSALYGMSSATSSLWSTLSNRQPPGKFPTHHLPVVNLRKRKRSFQRDALLISTPSSDYSDDNGFPLSSFSEPSICVEQVPDFLLSTSDFPLPSLPEPFIWDKQADFPLPTSDISDLNIFLQSLTEQQHGENNVNELDLNLVRPCAVHIRCPRY